MGRGVAASAAAGGLPVLAAASPRRHPPRERPLAVAPPCRPGRSRCALRLPARRSGSVMNVFVVDDSAVVRRMMGALLAAVPDVVVVGEASSAEACFSPIETLAPDVVGIDWSMPGMNGIEATAELHRTRPQVRVVGFTSTDDRCVHEAFIAAGPSAVFAKADAMALRDHLLAAATVG